MPPRRIRPDGRGFHPTTEGPWVRTSSTPDMRTDVARDTVYPWSRPCEKKSPGLRWCEHGAQPRISWPFSVDANTIEEFIEASREDVPWLVDQVESLERWKVEALEVMSSLRELGSSARLGLGVQITGPAALAEVTRRPPGVDALDGEVAACTPAREARRSGRSKRPWTTSRAATRRRGSASAPLSPAPRQADTTDATNRSVRVSHQPDPGCACDGTRRRYWRPDEQNQMGPNHRSGTSDDPASCRPVPLKPSQGRPPTNVTTNARDWFTGDRRSISPLAQPPDRSGIV